MDPAPSLGARRRERLVLAGGLLSSTALLVAGLLPRGDAELRGAVELERSADQARDLVRLAWEQWLEREDLGLEDVQPVFWPPAGAPVRAIPVDRNTAEPTEPFDVLLADAERADREPHEALAALDAALEAHPRARRRREGLLRAIQLAAKAGDATAAERHLTALNETCAPEDARGEISYRLLGALAAGPVLAASDRRALQEDLRGAWERAELALPAPADRWVREERRWRFVPDPLWAALAERCRALDPDGDADAPAHLPRSGAALDSLLGARPEPPPRGWSLHVAPELYVLARRETPPTRIRGKIVEPEALLAALAREAEPGSGFALVDATTRAADGAWRGEPFAPAPGAPLAVIEHPDPASWAEAEAGRLLTLRVGFGALALFTAVATLFTTRALARERRVGELKSRFVAGVSHDLRTPLASILLMAENLEAGRVDETRRERYYATLRREATRLRRLVDDVLDFSRLERGQAPKLVREEADVARLADELAAESRERVEAAGGRLALVCEDCPESFDLDADAVRRAVGNLVDNALKHSGSTELELALRGRDRELWIEVADGGRGIPAARREDVFRPFERLPEANDTAGGTGLGLAIVREIARAHGGDAEILDEPGGGARVRLRLANGGTA